MKTTKPTTPVPKAVKPLWTEYMVRWTFLTKLCGSIPANPDMVKSWLEARQPAVKPAGAKSITELKEEVIASLLEGDDVPQTLLRFQREAGVLSMRAATVRAHIKDCARVLSAQFIDKVQGERAFSTRVINGVYPDETQYWLPVRRPDGSPVREADGVMDKAVHARGPRGEPLNCLKSFEYVEPAMLIFRLKVLGASVAEEDLRTLFLYGGVHGYAGERGDGEGKYTCELIRTE